MSGESSARAILFLVVLNVVCSVSIVTVRADARGRAPCAAVCAGAGHSFPPITLLPPTPSRPPPPQVNKLLVEHYGFKFVLLLSALHFLTGFIFLRFASTDRCKLFSRADAPANTIYKLGLAGAGSIALLNYSLRLNSVGTYQIMKVAILPVVMALSVLQGVVSMPSRNEAAAAALVVVGTLICTASDVWVTMLGLLVGGAGVVSTAQYQIWQGAVQVDNNISSTQALYLMSLPQAIITFAASLLFETDWASIFLRSRAFFSSGTDALAPAASTAVPEDIWSHPYSPNEVGLIFFTCVLAVALNYSSIAVIGRTSAVTMQFVNQLKTVLTIGMGYFMFPPPTPMPSERLMGLVGGLALVVMGVTWYSRLRAQASRVQAPRPGSG